MQHIHHLLVKPFKTVNEALKVDGVEDAVAFRFDKVLVGFAKKKVPDSKMAC